MKTKLLTILLTLLPLVTWGQGTVEGDDGTAEPYVVLTGDTISGTTLTFYYDNQQAAHQSAMPLPNNGYSVTWENYKVGITKVVFDPSFANYTSLESTGFWFSQCDKLVTIEGIENLKTDNVTNMGFMFRGCSSLTSLDVSGFKTDKVTSMGLMFYGCSGLTNLDVSGFNTANVTTMESMFGGCSGLTTLDVSSFNTANVEHMTLMFYGCSNLTTIYAGDGWNFEKVGDNGAIMFYNCPKLVGGKGTTYDANRVDYTYARIDGGPNSETPGYFTRSGDAPYVAPEPYAVLSENNTVLTFYYDKEKQIRGGLDVIEWWVGYEDLSWHPYRETITNIVFDSTFINCTTLGCAAYWFRNCVNLTTISGLQYFNTENIQYMGSMFEGCYSLTDLDVSGFNTAKVTDMWNMFKDCSALTSLDLSSFNTSTAIAMNNMFDGCANLKTIYAGSDWSIASITSDDDGANMFLGCTRLVGGAGTAYDANHTDYTYARIDGGPNSDTPGYFTDENAPVYVAAPTFRFEGDNLVMESETEGASIFYQMEELPNMDEATIEKISSGMTVTADAQQSIYYEQPIEITKSVIIKAIAAGEALSEVSTLVYDYDAWQDLLKAMEYGADVYGRAQGNSAVDTTLLEDLGWMLDEGKMFYDERASMDSYEAQHFSERIMELAHQIEEMMTVVTEPEPYAVLSYSESSLAQMWGIDYTKTLTFYYDGQRENRGGMSVMPFGSYESVPWASDRDSITTVVFDPSFAECKDLTSTAYWFAGCQFLGEVLGMENLHTDNVTEMNNMFNYCYSLTSLDVSGFNTSKVTNMEHMFSSCFGLENLDVSGFNTSKVTNMGNMFVSCSKLKEINLKGFDTANVMDMTYMFAGCSSLTSLDVSGFKTDNVTDMSYMFSNCSGLTSLDLSTFNTSNVTDMGGLFYQCYNLSDLNVLGFNTENVTNMERMFWECSNLAVLDISTFKTSKVLSLNRMISDCPNLTTIYVGDEWTTESVKVGTNMFTGSSSLVGGAGTTYDANHTDYTYAHIDGGPSNPGYFTDKNATGMKDGDIFTAINSDGVELRYMIISEANKTCQVGDKPYSNIASSNDIATAVDTSYVGTIRIPEEARGYSVVRVGFEAFLQCGHVTLVEIPNSVTEISSEAFAYSGITSITIPSSVTKFENSSLGHCPHLESIVVDSQNPVFDSRNGCNAIIRTSSNTLVRGCTTTILTEKDGVVTIGHGAFLECQGKEWSMVLPNTITSIETQAFNSCDLTAITLPSTLKSVGWAAFLGSKITSLVVPASVTTIGEGALHSSTMTSLVVDAGNATFDSRENCNAVIETATNKLVCGIPTSVIPEGVTTIGTHAFDEIHNLKSITLPASVTSIENRAFWSSGLESITSLIENPFEISENTFDEYLYKNCELRVPTGATNVYRDIPYWNKFVNIVENAPAIDVTFDSNGVLTVGSETTMPDALETVGGRAEVAKAITAIVWNSTATLANSDLQGLDNPNMLIYVKDAAFVPANRNNVVVGDFAKNIVLMDVTEGNNNFYCPKEFKAEMISYTRNFQQQTEIGISRGWESIALPFTVQTIVHETNGEIAPFGSGASNKHFWLRRLGANGLVGAQQIEANVPYIISMPNSDAYSAEFNQAGRVTFSSQNVTVPVTELMPTAYNDSSIVMMPAMQRQDKSSSVWAINVGESRDKYFEGSVFERDYRVVRPFEAYTVHRGDGAAPRFVPIVDMADGGVTGIEDLTPSLSKGEGTWYDLSGRKLQQRPTQKGVYILDGKKTVVK